MDKKTLKDKLKKGTMHMECKYCGSFDKHYMEFEDQIKVGRTWIYDDMDGNYDQGFSRSVLPAAKVDRMLDEALANGSVTKIIYASTTFNSDAKDWYGGSEKISIDSHLAKCEVTIEIKGKDVFLKYRPELPKKPTLRADSRDYM